MGHGQAGLLLATILVGALVTGPSIDALLDAAEAGADADWTLAAAVGSQAGMVLAAVVLAVFKPGGRLPCRSGAGRTPRSWPGDE